MSFDDMITIILGVILVISYIGLRIVRKKHQNDPEYMKRQEEEMRMERAARQQDQDMEDYMFYPDMDPMGDPGYDVYQDDPNGEAQM